MKKIKWRNTYYPSGEWVDDNGDAVKIKGSFRATHEGEAIIVAMIPITSSGGHGESGFTSNRPFYLNESTLENIEIDGFINI